MTEYTIKVYGENTINHKDIPCKPINFSLFIDTNTIEEAAVRTVQELEIIGFNSKHNNTWNAKIVNPEGEDYEILRKGNWLINTETGEKINSLEKKLD